MDRNRRKRYERARRHRRVRKKLAGSAAAPRLCVFRSHRHIYAQIIDDERGRTLVAASTLSGGGENHYGGNFQAAAEIGKRLAELARAQNIQRVVFDRGGYKYHGRIRALAEAARAGGLTF